MGSVFSKDLYRYYGAKETKKQRLFRPLELRYLYVFRRRQETSGIIRKWYIFRMRYLTHKTQIQIPSSVTIGEGLYIGHCGRIIVNSDVVIGKNVNLATGITIGQENRGDRKGCPIIGDRVWIGTNAVVVGKIKIGNDVLIAPLTFVNFDVPDHSIVIGNPARIISNSNATEFYIENMV